MSSSLKSITLLNGKKINNSEDFQKWITNNKIIRMDNGREITALGSQLLIFYSTKKTSSIQSYKDEKGFVWKSKSRFVKDTGFGKYTREDGSSYIFKIELREIKIIGNKFKAKVQMDGTYLEAKIYKNMDNSKIDKLYFENILFNIAKKYVKDKKVGLRISKPRSWSTTSAHVTLENNSFNRSLLGKDVIVTVGELEIFKSTTTWVSLSSRVKTLQGKVLYCPYSHCHISIGEEKKPGIGKLKNKKTIKRKKTYKRKKSINKKNIKN